MRTYKQFHDKIKYSNHWSTPREIYDNYVLIDQYVDPCPLHGTAFKFGTIYDNVFLNPPYQRGILEKWIEWAIENHIKANNHTVILIPARTDTKYFHKLLEYGVDIEFIKGRLKFGGATKGAPFPSVLIHLQKKY